MAYFPNNQFGGGGGFNQQQGNSSAPGLPPTMGQGFIQPEARSIYTPAFAVPGYDQSQARFQQGAQQAAARGPGQFQQGQADLISMLQAQAQGQGPSVAQDQLKQATDRGISQTMALGASQAGYQPGPAVQRQILNQNALTAQDAASQSAQLRAREIVDARGQLAGALGQARGQDLEMRQINDQLVQFYEQQGLGLDLAQAKAAQDLQALLSGNMAKMEGIRSQERVGQQSVSAQREASSKSLIGSIFSDERLKENIVENEEDLHDFLDHLGGRE